MLHRYYATELTPSWPLIHSFYLNPFLPPRPQHTTPTPTPSSPQNQPERRVKGFRGVSGSLIDPEIAPKLVCGLPANTPPSLAHFASQHFTAFLSSSYRHEDREREWWFWGEGRAPEVVPRSLTTPPHSISPSSFRPFAYIVSLNKAHFWIDLDERISRV